jgi:outer membrane lipoprotein-sorting protein
MTTPHHERPDDLVQRAVETTLQLPLPDGPSHRVMSQTLASLQHASPSPRVTFSQRVKHMSWQYKTSALLAVAASLLVVYLGISNNRALAFADVVKALAEVRSATWKMVTETALSDGQVVKSTAKGMFLAPSRERLETTTNGMLSIQITDGTKDKTLSLNPATKTAMAIELKNAPANRGSSFSQLSTALRDMAQLEERMRNQNLEHLKARTIGGVKAEGLRWRFGSLDTEIWVNPETRLPIRVEYKATQPSVYVVMTDFQVNAELDESLFSLDLPEGYTVRQTAEVDFTKKPIVFLADALRLAADFNDGMFPDELRGANGIDGILQTGIKNRAMESGNDPATLKKLTTEVPMALGGAFGMLFSLSPEANDWHYAGKGVKLNTPNRPIFWYKPHKASEVYTVLYADLSVKVVTQDQVPTVPPAE